jgi:uncharacterized protein (TIGR02246 family)
MDAAQSTVTIFDSPQAAVTAYFDALNKASVEGIVRLFADDGAFMANEAETVRGKDDLRRAYTEAFKGRSFQRRVHVDLVQQEGDLATVRMHTTGTITSLADRKTTAHVSRELFTLRKGPDGWRITDYMFNRTAPAPGH